MPNPMPVFLLRRSDENPGTQRHTRRRSGVTEAEPGAMQLKAKD